MAMAYLWLKSIHVIAVIAWMAGIFYIFRLFVYHVQQRANESMAAVFRTMERKLLNIIMLPAAVLSVIFGTWMIWDRTDFLHQPWLWIKLVSVAGMITFHWFSEYTAKRFARDDYFLTEKQCRALNEVPTILMFVIVFMVILKPFAG
jgi:putative membrane protein